MTTRIALLGDHNPAYPSHREVDAVVPQLQALAPDLEARWVPTGAASDLEAFDAVWLMPGSPYADDAAVLRAITWARSGGVPFLGTCGGLQYAVLEYARSVLGRAAASHAEVDGESADNVVAPLACSLHGQEREVRPVPGTRFAELVGGRSMPGMHYCGYGPTAEVVRAVSEAGMVVSATADDAGAEVLELPSHPFFLLTLFQPQVGASQGRPVHPVLQELVRAAGSAAASADGAPAPNVTGVQR